MSYDNPQSRNEAILQNILGADNVLEPPQSRTEAALTAILNGEEYTGEAKSRVEMLLKEISQQGGGNVDVEALAVDANGTYTAPSGKAYSPVTVDVAPDLMTKSVTENGTYQAASDNVDGYSSVTVDVEANVGTKSITQNGTYTASADNVDGYSEVTVNVSGGGQEVPEKDVNFIDYDGTVLYSYTAQEALALTALPANPSHDGLTAQGWNWTLANMQSYVTKYGKCLIGQMYITDDGKTRIHIALSDGRVSPTLSLYCETSGTCVVNWGDGTAEETITGSGGSFAHTTHTYSASGAYTISLDVTSGKFSLKGQNNYGTSILWANKPSNNSDNRTYQTAIREVHIGAGMGLREFAFKNCYTLFSLTIPDIEISNESGLFAGCRSLKTIVMPKDATSISYYMCQYCYGLKHIIFGEKLTYIDTNAFSSCNALQSVTLPEGASYINNGTFEDCYSLASVVVPDGMKYFQPSSFSGCLSLTTLDIPSSITTIYASACYNCVSMASIKFHSQTPPTVANSAAFYNLPTDCKIYVPQGSLSAYTSATNYPSSSTYTYVEY